MEDRCLAKNTKKNSWKSSRVDNSGVPRLYPAKTGTLAKNTQKSVGSQAEKTTQAYLDFIRQRQVHIAFYTNGRARAVRVLLDFSIMCFWPQTDKVHLFLVAALKTHLSLRISKKAKFVSYTLSRRSELRDFSKKTNCKNVREF